MSVSPASPRLFCFGMGFSAKRLARHAFLDSWAVAGTARTSDSLAAIEAAGARAFPFERGRPLPTDALAGTTHLLVSIPPDSEGDPVLGVHRADIAALPGLAWIGYLSSTGVYGHANGKAVDENAPLRPSSEHARRRVPAEQEWLSFGSAHNLPVHVFRLSGIYGSGRSALDKLRNGTAQRIDRPGHLFSRIHAEDIARVLKASIAKPNPGAIYNVADDEPAPPADVIAYAAQIMGLEPPPLVPFDEAAAKISPMALSFWNDNRLVSNARIKTELGVQLRYSDYRKGLSTILGTGG
ncbi:MAG: SDR family oxidoreductase [Proteobacteria bacterium]|nr:SDR family oxidoreductase [Pseudomonadota bacterium]